ncbi:efflux RND transporter periplasmic adaptor subunit [Corallococcus macrosporus]|uniref:Efflux RND transporter periplasmic adaptor subunit n=1 Tax=Corallococcus macrosporus TaxID=35 RepID=A0ABS3DPX3_9BACT|nr:efflux RND transporter periplasmic adaptor subunit [Corallococcus macrosporus]MBN8233374.1 efflux RND transporter periplasmic adaptor subunit [Corallococcus macrosporus]
MVFRRLASALGLLLLVVVATMVGLRARTPEGSMDPRPSQPEPQLLTPDPLAATSSWLGVVIAEESVDLAASREGRVANIRVQVGDAVKQGEVVATLDVTAAQQELAVAEAELLSSRAELRTSQLALDEARERLVRRDSQEQLRTGAVSHEEVSTARYQEQTASAKLEVAQAQILEREAKVAQLRRNVTETSIRAPFQGVVASRFVATGAQIQAGQPILHLLRSGAVQVRFALPPADARHVAVGQRLLLEATDQQPMVRGRVIRVAPEVDVAAMKVFAVAELEAGPDAAPPAGTVVHVRVEPGSSPIGLPTVAGTASNHP